MSRTVLLAALLGAFVGCGGAHTLSAGTNTGHGWESRSDDVVMSSPAEYDLTEPVAAAGEAIFTRTGIGDPYATGLPYPVFLALLQAWPEALGGTVEGFANRFGFLARSSPAASDALPAPGSGVDLDTHEGLPIGMHLTVDPLSHVPFVVTNCSLCHAERVRWPGGEQLVVGLGNRRVRVHAYDDALRSVALRHDFTSARVAHFAAELASARGIPWPAAWRGLFVDASVAALRARASNRASFLDRVGDEPAGRIATIEAFAVAMEGVVHHPVPTGDAVGWARIPDVVGFPYRQTLSWDAVGTGPLDTLVVEADFAFGVRARWYHDHPQQGPSLTAYLRAPRAPIPFPAPIDTSLAARGHVLFDSVCADCHGSYGADGLPVHYTESVRDIGVDPTRAQAVSDAFVAAANAPPFDHPGLHTRRTGGYVPPVLTRIWLRGPYGHAGQWPSLAVIATPPPQRPTHYVVNLEAPLDLATVGVPMRAPGGELETGEVNWDGMRTGFSVGGHPFLADLGADDARSVIEYLKTL